MVSNVVWARDADLYTDFRWARLKRISNCASWDLGTKASRNGHTAKVNNDRMFRRWAPGPFILPVGPTCLGHFDYFWGLLQIARP